MIPKVYKRLKIKHLITCSFRKNAVPLHRFFAETHGQVEAKEYVPDD